MKWSRCLGLLAVVGVTLVRPPVAHADGFISPGIGVAFGNPSAQGRANLVVDVGWLSREPIGVELDTTFAPSFFGVQGSYGSNGVTTVMGNVLLAGGGSGRYSRFRGSRAVARPYISGGLGLIRETTTTPAVSINDLGANLGVGVTVVARGQVGVRGDVRYFRDLVGTSNGSTTNIDFGSFHFWRASVGVVFGF